MACGEEGCKVFDKLSTKFSYLALGRNAQQQQHLNLLLTELNSLNYKFPVVTNNTDAVLLIHHCCTIVPPSEFELVEKCSTLITNLVAHQKVPVKGRTLTFAVEWNLEVLKQPENPTVAVLKCLECLIRDNVEYLEGLLPHLLGEKGVLRKLSQEKCKPKVQFWAVKCLEAITYTDEEQTSTVLQSYTEYLKLCGDTFLNLLIEQRLENSDEVTNTKLFISCLRGLQSIISQCNYLLKDDLGLLLGIARSYMTYCLYNTVWTKPEKIMPSNLNIADFKPSCSREKKGGKMPKHRKQRKSTPHKKEEIKRSVTTNLENPDSSSSYIPIALFSESSNSLQVTDSDVTDSEAIKINNISNAQGKVRQAALNLLHIIIKVTDKHKMFGYWSSFFPCNSPYGAHSLNQCVLQEPSPRGRIAILTVISTMLNGSKLYLSQAEFSEKTYAFTPFSITLGAMIIELHHTLCLALKDKSIPSLNQVLKCLALLVQASPYHRLSPGLIVQVVKNVQCFLRHRDATVQVAALIVLGCVVASEPTVSETLTCLSETTSKRATFVQTFFSDSEHDVDQLEPSEDESQIVETNANIPWLLEKCLRNLGVVYTTKTVECTVPAPVKLESLQVLSAMCRNYYSSILSQHILQVAKALEISLSDKYTDLRLHAGRTVDSIGHAMQQHIQSSDEARFLTLNKGLIFWQNLLNGPLVALLQDEQHVLRTVGCDCLGAVGQDIFEHLPKEKQILIVTLLFSGSRDDENSVKGAAVRALAISVLYPSLREDLGFIMDTAEVITRTLDDSNVTLRVKSSWSLGNLSDALVLYRKNLAYETLPDSLILKLLWASIKIADDVNKIKSNAARAIGNLLRLVTTDLLKQKTYQEMTEKAISVLVKNSTTCTDMKVRWNSCYAIGNMMKNTDLFAKHLTWQNNVYLALDDLLLHCHNLKVRINAALALSVPAKRKYYGKFYLSTWKSLLEALEISHNMEDYTEFKHRDNLIDQICLTICHLATLLTPEDMPKLEDILSVHGECWKTYMQRVHERLVPEKAEVFIRAASRLESMNAECSQEKSTQKDCISTIVLLKSAFECQSFM